MKPLPTTTAIEATTPAARKPRPAAVNTSGAEENDMTSATSVAKPAASAVEFLARTKARDRANLVRLRHHLSGGIAEELRDMEAKRGPIYFEAELWEELEDSPAAVMTVLRCAEAARARMMQGKPRGSFTFEVSAGGPGLVLDYFDLDYPIDTHHIHLRRCCEDASLCDMSILFPTRSDMEDEADHFAGEVEQLTAEAWSSD